MEIEEIDMNKTDMSDSELLATIKDTLINSPQAIFSRAKILIDLNDQIETLTKINDLEEKEVYSSVENELDSTTQKPIYSNDYKRKTETERRLGNNKEHVTRELKIKDLKKNVAEETEKIAFFRRRLNSHIALAGLMKNGN